MQSASSVSSAFTLSLGPSESRPWEKELGPVVYSGGGMRVTGERRGFLRRKSHKRHSHQQISAVGNWDFFPLGTRPFERGCRLHLRFVPWHGTKMPCLFTSSGLSSLADCVHSLRCPPPGISLCRWPWRPAALCGQVTKVCALLRRPSSSSLEKVGSLYSTLWFSPPLNITMTTSTKQNTQS